MADVSGLCVAGRVPIGMSKCVLFLPEKYCNTAIWQVVHLMTFQLLEMVTASFVVFVLSPLQQSIFVVVVSCDLLDEEADCGADTIMVVIVFLVLDITEGLCASTIKIRNLAWVRSRQSCSVVRLFGAALIRPSEG